jgi:UDP-N-acetylglucosamine--N-acetylmuramyl-(pentapeptide) pyrophosphoryl-undecaprenol N-acetylglucosamine transferase
VLCRAGAITIAEIAAAGVASILVPLTVSTTSHQRDNAVYMHEAGAAIHLPQPELSAESLAQLLRGLARKQLLAMAIAARAIAQPDATNRVAALCEEMAKR